MLDRIRELEAQVETQRARIVELEAAAKVPAGEELAELRAIVDAQESAMNDQKGIIEAQGGIIEDLNSQLQLLLAETAAADATPEVAAPPAVAAATPGVAGPPVAQARSSASVAHGPSSGA